MLRTRLCLLLSFLFCLLLTGPLPSAFAQTATENTSAPDSTALIPEASSLSAIVTRRQAQRQPLRSLAGMANLLPGVDLLEGTNQLVLRAEDPSYTVYYQDGLRLTGLPRLPFSTIQRVSTFLDHIPATYGESTTGVVAIETHEGRQDRFFGQVEALTSEVLDAYGHNLGALTLGGPLGKQNLHFFAHAAFGDQGDNDPRAVRMPRLSDNALNALHAQPQVLQITNPTSGITDYIGFPSDLPDGLGVADLLAALDMPAGFVLASPNPIDAATLYTSDALTSSSDRVQNDAQTARFYGSLAYDPTSALSLRFAGQHWSHRGRAFDPAFALFNPNRIPELRQQQTYIYASARYILSERMAYQLRAHFTQSDAVQHDPFFSEDVEDVFFYGDVDHPANRTAQLYRSFNGVTFNRAIQDGDLPNESAIHSIYASPATGGHIYSKQQDRAFRFDASVEAFLGFHNLAFGLAFEQQKQRLFRIAPAMLAQFYDDETLEIGINAQDRVATYNELRYDHVALSTTYYGYNHLGTTSVENQDVDVFSASATLNPQFATPSPQDFHLAPFTPYYYALYGRDRLRYLNFDLDIGLRLDVSGSNGLAPKDPFALYPIIRAGDVSGVTVPAHIDKTDAVYFNGLDEIVGYRNNEGQFFDAAGQNATRADITRFAQVRVQTAEQEELLNRVTSSVLETPTPQLVIQPRVAARFELDDETNVYAHYNVLARRPRSFEYETIQGYIQATQTPGLPTLNNPNLKPEKTTSIGLGLEREVTPIWTIQASAYFRTLGDRIGLRFVDAFPTSYLTYDNIHDATVQGVDLVSVFEPVESLRIVTHYSFLRGRGTNAAATIVDELFPPNVINIARPSRSLDLERQHQLKFILDYTAAPDASPVFANTHISLFAQLKSGLPYTSLTAPLSLFDTVVGAPGDINNETTPFTSLVNLKVERGFALQERINLTAYLWITNLLDSQNALSVYPFTGEPDTDDWLGSEAGTTFVSAIGTDQSARAATAFSDQYQSRLRNPLNYGLPRQIRLGFRLDF